MRVGVVLWPTSDWPAMADIWRRAEELGFDTGWLYDHLAWRGHTPWDEAYTSLAAAAAVTSTIRLGTLVTSANFRHPVPTAAQIRTVDRISGGRLTLGIGAGGAGHTSDGDVLDHDWTPRERADRFAELVEHLDALLTRSPVSLDGEHWQAREATVAPGLVQQRPPFWVAAHGPRGIRLAARFGQGWIVNPDDGDGDGDPQVFVRERIARLHDAGADLGRDTSELRILRVTGFTDEPWLASPEAFEHLCGVYGELGVTDIALHWPRPGTDWEADAGTFEAVAEVARRMS